MHRTNVYFRVFPEGDVIALFPDQSEGLGEINSYQRIGQHGAASRSLLTSLRKAKRSEYVALKAELETIGYVLCVKRG